MTKTSLGWTVLVAALGMMFTLLSVDIAALKDWNQALTPVFVATFIGHIGAVIAAFVGGKIIPESRDSQYTRSSDHVGEK